MDRRLDFLGTSGTTARKIWRRLIGEEQYSWASAVRGSAESAALLNAANRRTVGRLRRLFVSDNFAHGKLYGDYSGITFYGPSIEGQREDRLDVSDRFIEPLFQALLDRASLGGGVQHVPTLVMDWNILQGWADAAGAVAIPPGDAEDLAMALGNLSANDLARHASGASVPECLESALLVRELLCSRLARGVVVYIELT